MHKFAVHTLQRRRIVGDMTLAQYIARLRGRQSLVRFLGKALNTCVSAKVGVRSDLLVHN